MAGTPEEGLDIEEQPEAQTGSVRGYGESEGWAEHWPNCCGWVLRDRPEYLCQ